MRSMVAALAIAGALTGCASMPTQQEINSADYGPYPDNYQEIIKQDINTVLIDPASAMYSFKTPWKGVIGGNMFVGMKTSFGYIVCGSVNSKNRMGGYAGAMSFVYVLKNGTIAAYKIGNPASSDFYETNSLANNYVAGACRNAR